MTRHPRSAVAPAVVGGLLCWGMLWAAPAEGQRTTFASVDPGAVSIEAGGRGIQVRIRGSDLNVYPSAVVEVSGRSVTGVRASIVSATSTDLVLLLEAETGVRLDRGSVALVSRTARVTIPNLIVSVTAPAFRPVSVASGTLEMTGRRFEPRTISTGALIMTGRREDDSADPFLRGGDR